MSWIWVFLITVLVIFLTSLYFGWKCLQCLNVLVVRPLKFQFQKQKVIESTFEDIRAKDDTKLLTAEEKFKKFQTINDVLRYRKKVHPNRNAYVWLNEKGKELHRVSFSELHHQVRVIAKTRFSKVKKGEKVLIILPPGLEYNITLLACFYVGLIPIPVYPPRRYRIGVKRIRNIIKISKPSYIISSRLIYYQLLFLSFFFENFLKNQKWIYVPSFKEIKRLSSSFNESKLIKVDKISQSLKSDSSYIQFTSSTTSVIPKGCVIHNKGIMHILKLVHENIVPPKVGMNYWTNVSFIPGYHDTGLFLGLLSGLYNGITTVQFSPLAFIANPSLLLKVTNTYKAAFTLVINDVLDHVLKNVTKEQREIYPIPSDCCFIMGSQVISPRTLKTFSSLYKVSNFVTGYGLAEFTLAASFRKEKRIKISSFEKGAFYRGIIQGVKVPDVKRHYVELVSLGGILKTSKYAIVDPLTLKELPDNIIGELLLCDDSVCSGYLNDKENEKKNLNVSYIQKKDGKQSKSVFLRTGDYCFVYENELYFVDRICDLIKYKGKRFHPFLIENVVNHAHEYIKVSNVFSVPLYKGIKEDKIVIVVEIPQKYYKKYKKDVYDSITEDVSKEFGIIPALICIAKENTLPKTCSSKYSRSTCKRLFLKKRLKGIIGIKNNESLKGKENLNIVEEEEKKEKEMSFEGGKDLTSYVYKKLDYLRDYDKKHSFILKFLKERVSKTIDVENIDVTRPLTSYGISSIMAVKLTNELSKTLGKKISATLLFNYPTVEKIALFLETSIFQVRQKTETIIKGILGIEPNTDPIAVIGIGCRFNGGCNDVSKYWNLLVNGKSGIIEVPKDRWDLDDYYDPDPEAFGKMYTRRGGFLREIDKFDPSFFKISPREAELMDPQQRILLEVSWNAFEHAGIIPKKLFESKTGVFIASCSSDYASLLTQFKVLNPNAKDIDYRYVGTGTSGSVLAGRLSYFYGLQGPALTVDTACSSSLVSTHLACQALRNGECNLALAGGINLTFDPELYVTFSKTRMLSPDGKCKTFDDSADGYVRGEGCGLVLLKRLSDAKRDGDKILGVIRGSAINQDGKSAGITAPNSLSQEVVIKTALYNSKCTANEIDYIEAHGTGTSLGDPIEIQSLMSVFGGQNRKTPLVCGSVKTNIGHTEGAAGIAGMIKILLALQKEKIPQHLNLSKLNKRIPTLQLIPMYIPFVDSMEWERSEDRKRIAGVSSFGFSGTNSHLILEEGPEYESGDDDDDDEEEELREEILCLSANSKYSLKENLKKYIEFVDENFEDLTFRDLCFTHNTTRTHFHQRIAFKCDSLTNLKSKMEEYLKSDEETGVIGVFNNVKKKSTVTPCVVFLFTGQGSQYTNMGKTLYNTQPVFKKWMDECDKILSKFLDDKQSILEIIFKEENKDKLRETRFCQPALFAIEYATSKMWGSFGIVPDYVMGHSLGEIVAACVSDVFTLEEGLELITKRSKFMHEAEKGSMAAVFIPENKVVEIMKECKSEVCIASINGQTNTVISGVSKEVEKLLEVLSEKKVKFKKLEVSHAFHSNMMDSILSGFEQSIRRIKYQIPVIPIVSNLYGEIIEGLRYKIDSRYWKKHIRNPVQFLKGIERLVQREGKNLCFIEVGPKAHLISMTKRILMKDKEIIFIPTFNEEKEVFNRAICELYVGGLDFSWDNFYKHQKESGQKVGKRMLKLDLPVYQFQKKRFWISAGKKKVRAVEGQHPLLGTQYVLPSQTVFQHELTNQYFVDHKIFNYQIFPGTGYLEMALGSIPALYSLPDKNGKIYSLENVTFEGPLLLNQNRVVQTMCKKFKEKTDIEIYTVEKGEVDNKWNLHASASVKAVENDESLKYIELDELLKTKKLEVEDLEDFYNTIGENGFNYGKRFKCVRKLYKISDEESFGLIEIDPGVKDEHDNYLVHPSVIDSCLHVIFPLASGNGKDIFLPFSFKKVLFFSGNNNNEAITKVYCHCYNLKVEKDFMFVDLNIYSFFTKEILFSIKEFRVAKVSRSGLEKMIGEEEKVFYKVDWKETKITENKAIVNKLKNEKDKKPLVVLFSDKKDYGKTLQKLLESNKFDVVNVGIGNSFKKMGSNEFYANPIKKDGMLALFKDNIFTANKDRQIVLFYLWNLNMDLKFLESKYEECITLNCGTMLYLVQALFESKIKMNRFFVVTKGVFGDKIVSVEQSAIWGMCRSIAIEHPEINLVRIDLDGNYPDNQLHDAFLMIGEYYRDHRRNDSQLVEDEIRFVKNKRLIPVLKLASVNKMGDQIKHDKKENSVLITGGTRGIGLAVANVLKENGFTKIILLSRSVPKEVDVLIKNKFIVEQGDVCNASRLKELFEKHKPFFGVIHCAGVWSDSLLMNQTWENFAKALNPKILGAWNLHLMSKQYPMEQFVLFSSVASVFGSPGQTNYTSANFFLDTLSNYRRSQNLPSLVVNWGSWSEIGLASRANVFVEKFGINNFTPSSGIDVFKRIFFVQQSKKHDGTFIPVLVNWIKFFNSKPDPIPTIFESIIREYRWKRKKTGTSKKYLKLKKKLSSISDPKKRHKYLVSQIQLKVAQVLQTEADEVDVNRPLLELGMDSLTAIELRNSLSESVGANLPATMIFDYPNIDKLSGYIATKIDLDDEVKEAPKMKKISPKPRISQLSTGLDEPIAVIGMSCRLPTGTMRGFGNDPKEFWKMMMSQKGCSEEIPPNRFDYEEYFDKDGGEKKMYVKWGTFINKPFTFDPLFFGISSAEAKAMDPQQRLLLEVTWEGLESSGIIPSKLIGTKTGVFIGNMFLDYRDIINKYEIVNYAGTGNHLSVLAGRVSYVFGFQGPVITMDTACSSSLVTTHMACQSLRNGECNLAVAGGVNLLITPHNFISECSMGMLSPKGLCKTFDDSADGYLRGEGCGIVILKRLSDAKRDGDNIIGILKGSSVNHDGRSAGLTAPNGESQEKVITSALKQAKLSPDDIDVIEAHGTGTSLGDPIEIGALIKIFGNSNRKTPLYLSSVKTYIGHAEGCAGIAGVLKLLLSLQHEKLPKHLNFKKLNTHMPTLKDHKITLTHEKIVDWKKDDKRKRRAAVSSFGFSGTNAHMIVEEAPSITNERFSNDGDYSKVQVLSLSAKSMYSLREMAFSYVKYIEENVDIPLNDITFTANTRKSLFNFRVSVTGKTRNEMVLNLNKFVFAKDLNAKGNEFTFNKTGNAMKKVVFFFTGQGSQYTGMGKELYENEPLFKKWMDKCDEILSEFLNKESILEIILKKENADKLKMTKYCQPALFAIEYSLFKMYESIGIIPEYVMGHSLGELVAACVGNVFSLKDGLDLICKRAKFMSQAESGAMAAIFTSEEKVNEVIKETGIKISIASLNGQTNTVVSGSEENISKLLDAFRNKKIKFKKLDVSHAFHSEKMDPVLDPFKKSIGSITYKEPKYPLVSNLFGEIIEDFENHTINGDYWIKHIRSPVKFLTGINALVKKEGKNLIFLELGAKPHLIGMAKRILADTKGISYINTMLPEKNLFFDSIGAIYSSGMEFEYTSFYEKYEGPKMNGRKVIYTLPLYPFEQHQYNCIPIEDRITTTNTYNIKWKEVPLVSEDGETKNIDLANGSTLILCDQSKEGFGRYLGEMIKNKGYDVCGAVIDEEFDEVMDNIFTINPNSKEDFIKLFNHDIWKSMKPLKRIVHMFSLGDKDKDEEEGEDEESDEDEDDVVEEMINKSIVNSGYSLIQLIQAIQEQKFEKAPKIYCITRNIYNSFTMFNEPLKTERAEKFSLNASNSSIYQSYIWGLAKGIRLEHPEFDFTIIDIDKTTKPKAIYNELTTVSDEPELSIVNNKRYVPRMNIYQFMRKNKLESVNINEKDTFLITGGTSGLGFAFTRFLIERKGLMNVILVSRSGVKKATVKQQIKDLNKRFGKNLNIIVLKCDIGSMESLRESFENLYDEREDLPKISGVINCAGVFDNCLISGMDFDRFKKLFGPKVYGTTNIIRVLSEDLKISPNKLKFFISFSSDVSTFGDRGQSTYSAVNSFLDVFSYFVKQKFPKCKSVAINWGLFGDVGGVTDEGSGMNDEEKRLTLLKYSGQRLLTSDLGFKYFDDILLDTNCPPRLGVVKLHWRNLVRYKFDGIAPKFISDISLSSSDDKQSQEKKGEAQISTLARKFLDIEKEMDKFKNEEEQIEHEKTMIVTDITRMVEEMLDKEEGEVDINKDLTEIGVDSITALSIRNDLQKYTGITLPVNMAFTNPNIKSIGSFIREQKEQIMDTAKEIQSSSTSQSEVGKKTSGTGLVLEKNISFFDGVKKLIKVFIRKIIRKHLKDEKLTDTEHLHELEANVQLTNEVRADLQKEYSVTIPVEEFFKRATINRYCNLVLKALFPLMFKDEKDIKLLFKELDVPNQLPKSLGYIYGTNWIQCPFPKPKSKLRMFLTPPAAMNPSFYRKIVPFFPDTIELNFIHLPGRTSRLNESLMIDMQKMAKEIVDGMDKSNILKDKDFVMYGHCFGGQLNYEVICELRRRKLPLPKHVYVFASHAPHITNGLFPDYQLNDDGILNFIKQTNDGVLPKPLLNKEMNKLVFAIMRADLQAVASQDIIVKEESGKKILFHNNLKEELPMLDMDITSWGGGKDQFVPEKYIREWGNLTNGKFSFELYKDSNHYPYVDVMGTLKEKIGPKIIKEIVKEVEKLL